MPTNPGIYIFKDDQSNILYVGKAKNLKSRVGSYFAPPVRLGPKTNKLVSLICSISHIEVGSEVEALLLESSLIKKLKPPYNIASKDDKSPYYIHITKETYPKPLINHEPKNSIAGPFLSGLIARKILKQFRRVAPYCIAPRPVKRPCFYSHLGLCNPCASTGDKVGYLKNIARLRSLLRGQFSKVSAQLKQEMQLFSKNMEYEKAAQNKSQIEALNYLLQAPVSPDEYLINPNLVTDRRQETLALLLTELAPHFPNLSSLQRIEMYDIANLSGTAATGAMTVAIDSELTPRLYRHFTIKTKSTPDDVGMLKEMLSRRLKRTDWPAPDLIVIDGGKSQLSIVDWNTPTIGLAKREELIYTPTGREIRLPKDSPALLLLERLRNEAHRFSRRLHHKHRSKSLL